MNTKDKLAEEILFRHRLRGGGMTENDMIEAMQEYHEAANKAITDEDIERHCNEIFGNLEDLWDNYYENYIAYGNGVKAFRVGKIKHIENGREDEHR